MSEEGLNPIPSAGAATPADDPAPQASFAPAPQMPGATPSSTPEPALADADRAALRQRLLRQFEWRLDRMLSGESPPEGIPEEFLVQAQSQAADSCGAPTTESDMYSMIAALTKLSGEIGLQGRTFRQLTDALSPLGQIPVRLEQLESAQHDTADHIRRVLEETEPIAEDPAGLPPAGELLGVLVDLHDRLKRGLTMVHNGRETIESAPKPCWLARWLGGADRDRRALELGSAMEDGYRMALARLQGAFEQWDIQLLGAPGDQFDPSTMTAIDVGPAGDAPDGTLLEVFRSGYMHRGKVRAPAQVRVARASA